MMAEEETVADYEKLEPIPVLYGFGTIIASVILFQVINQAVLRCLPTPKGVDKPWKWRNLFVSWIHAVIVGTWDISCFYWYPELATDLIAFHNLYLYTMVAFSTGYFVHDFIDIVVNKNLVLMWEVIPHHFAVAGMFFYNVVVSRCIAYNVVALLSEINTIFLHLRKLLQLAGVPHDHPVCRINAGVNLVTFVTCRFSGLVWIVGGMYVWGHRVTPVYYYILGTSMFVMWVTNMALFWRLLSSDVIRPWRKSRGRLQGDPKTNNHISTAGSVKNGNVSRTKAHGSGVGGAGLAANGATVDVLSTTRIDDNDDTDVVRNDTDILRETGKPERNGNILEHQSNNINVSKSEDKKEEDKHHHAVVTGVNNNGAVIRQENGLDSVRLRKP